MRVLNVNIALGAASGGGTGERTLQLSRALARKGVESAVLTLDLAAEVQSGDALDGVSVTALRCIFPRYYIFALPEPRVLELVRWADVIHVMNHWTLLNAVVYRAARRTGRPYVVCPAGALQVYGRSSLSKYFYGELVGNGIIRNAAACVAIAANEIDTFRVHGVPAERITVIPNGVDPTTFATVDPGVFRRKRGIEGAPFILFLGRLNPIKGPDLLLEAFARVQTTHPDLHLIFAGPDEGMLKTLQDAARRADISHRVHFTGFLTGTDKAAALAAAQFLVIPSRQEAMSIVVLEAGLCGTPVLITDRCGFNDVERIGGGKVVSVSVDSLESGLAAMLAQPQAMRPMGMKLREHVIQSYRWEATAQKYLELFTRVLAAQR